MFHQILNILSNMSKEISQLQEKNLTQSMENELKYQNYNKLIESNSVVTDFPALNPALQIRLIVDNIQKLSTSFEIICQSTLGISLLDKASVQIQKLHLIKSQSEAVQSST